MSNSVGYVAKARVEDWKAIPARSKSKPSQLCFTIASDLDKSQRTCLGELSRLRRDRTSSYERRYLHDTKSAYSMIRNRHNLQEKLQAEFGENGTSIEHGHADQAPDWLLAEWLEADESLIVIGDSHSFPYYQLDRFESYRGPLEAWLFCAGATARGLGNKGSALGYGARIESFISRVRKLKTTLPFIVMKFGQVDIEFTFQHQRIRDGMLKFREDEFHLFCKNSVSRYVSYLESVFTPPERRRVHIASINPPCLSDDTWATGYVQANWQIDHDMTPDEAASLTESVKTLEIPSLRQRTEMHRLFNDLLHRELSGTGFAFLSDFDRYIDVTTQIADERFIGPMAGTDWHLDRNLVSPVVMDNVRAVILSGR